MQLRFFLRRFAMLAATLLVSSFIIFSALYLAPGNPIAVLSGGRSLPPDAVKILEARYHLNDPFLVQYWLWLRNALHGDLGISITLRENVSDLITQRAGTTLGLALLLDPDHGAGRRPGPHRRPQARVDRHLGAGVTAVSAALPSFVAAIVLILVFSVGLGLVPFARGAGPGLPDAIDHLTLPAIALAAGPRSPSWRGRPRASVREEFGREHVQTATQPRHPGYRQLVRRHVLRNAAIPITTVTGITIASLIAGAAVVETAFGLNGLGAYLVSAAGVEGLRGRAGHLARARDHVRHRQPDRRRPLRRAGSRGSHSGAAPSEHRSRPRSGRGAQQRSWTALRATGPIGLLSAGVIAVAVLVTIFGPLIAPHDPYVGQLANSYVGPAPGYSARPRPPRAGTWCRGSWWGRGHRWSDHSWSSSCCASPSGPC